MDHWRPIRGGFAGNVGSEGGTVRLDDDHPKGARITLEEGGVTAPWSVTCGLYGLMLHTAFFASESDARRAVLVMKDRLEAIMNETSEDRVDELVGKLIAEF